MIVLMCPLPRCTILVAALLATASASAQAPRRAPDLDGMPVMSDTQAWCAHLASEVAALRQTLAGPHPAADRLAQQGWRLCSNGHVRLGISRLRYALIELHER
jgi:hypothetical protein